MRTLWNKSLDNARAYLHQLSLSLGENIGVQPSSHQETLMANQSLQMDIPSIKKLLPYESVDEEHFFINRSSIGFGFTFTPMMGADESLMKSLAELFKNKLPEGCDCTFLLYKHHYLSATLERSFSPILKEGGIYAELARLSVAFHLKAIRSGYANHRNVPAQLADYQGYIFVSTPRTPKAIDTIKKIQADFDSELKVAGFSHIPINAKEMLVLLRTLTTPNLHQIAWPEIELDGDTYLNEQILTPGSVYKIAETNLDITTHDENGEANKVRIINCALTSLSKSPFALWQTPDFFANLMRPEQGIQCPFLISMTVRGVNQEKMKILAKRRTKSLQSNTNAIQGFLNPSQIDETADWQCAHAEMNKGDLDLLPVFYNVMLLTHDATSREHLAQAISSYRQLGFTLTPAPMTQWLRYLASLPFMLSEGLFDSLKTLGTTHTLSHYNVANLIPIVADFKGSQKGLLLPTYRHQLFYYDPFDDVHLPITNFNRLTVASPGSGKSYLQQAMILDGLSRGHHIFVIDIGASYKNLCKRVGGTYLDVANLTLNPFTLFDFEGSIEMHGDQVQHAIQLRDLIALMASPNQPLDEIQRAWLLEALMNCWKNHGRQSCMDDVTASLRGLLSKADVEQDRRLKDLIVLLGKYERDGIYGDMFNGETPLLNGSKLTVLEMGGLGSNKELLTIVLFVMIVIIQGQFYHSDRRVKKQCIIDEAWRFLKDSSNPIAAEFIEMGFRTARKYSGGFSVITQNLLDTHQSVCGQAIEASTDTKIIMRQGNFKDYVSRFPNAFNPLQQQMIASFGEAKMQGFSNLMIQYGTVYTFHRYFSDPYSRILFSTSGDEFGAVESMVSSGVPLHEAVMRISEERYGEGR